MKGKFKQLFFSLYNGIDNAQLITFFNHIAIDEILEEKDFKTKPEILGRLYNGDFRIIPEMLNELKIEFKEEVFKDSIDIKTKYTIKRSLEIPELHILREKFLSNRVMLLPPDARLNDRLAEFGEVENMNPISKFLRIVSPVTTIDIDFQTFSGISEGETYINEEHKDNFSKIPVLPSIFEMKKTDINKINSNSYKSQILGLAKYIPKLPIIFAVLSDNCEITFLKTNRETGEIYLNSAIQLIESGEFETVKKNHDSNPLNNLSNVVVYYYKGSDPADNKQKELFTKIYKELTEEGEREG